MKLVVSLVVWLLNKSNLKLEDRTKLSTCVLDKLFALPFRDIIITSEGTLKINGRTPTMEEMRILQEQAKAALNNQTLKLIWDEVAFTAVKIGIHSAITNDQVYFAKSALWWGQQEQSLLSRLAGVEKEELVLD